MASIRSASLDKFVEKIILANPEYGPCTLLIDLGGQNISRLADYQIKMRHGKYFQIIMRLEQYISPYDYTKTPKPQNFSLLTAHIAEFTSNCGAKAVEHLHTGTARGVLNIENDNKDYIALNRHALFLLEAWARGMWGTSMLLGSDRVGVKDGKVVPFGQTSNTIMHFGDDYHWGDPIWNLNYPDDASHKICVFWKDLTKKREAYAAEYQTWVDHKN